MNNNKITLNIIFMFLLIFSNCSSNDEDSSNNDTTPPIVRIQSPILLLNYSTDIGNSNVPYRVNFQAYGIDETELKKFQLIVTNSSGIIVLEKNQEGDIDTKYSFSISEKFETTIPDTYTAVFTATDSNGNIALESKILTFSD